MRKAGVKTIIFSQNGDGISFLRLIVRRPRTFVFIGLACFLAVLPGVFFLFSQNVVSDQPPALANGANISQVLSATETAWGKFQVGSGIRTRTTTTTFQEKIVQDVAESTTTLEAIEPDGILLKQIASVEIKGNMVQGEPQLKKVDFYQQPSAGNTTVQMLPPERIQIGNRILLCGVRVYEQTTPQLRRRTKVWFNPKVAPYVLCTETTRTRLPTPNKPKEQLVGHSTSIVLNPPKTTLRGSFFGSYKVQTIRQNITDGSTVYSLAECSLRTPGWVESEKSWEYDRENNLVRITVSSGSTNK